MTKPYRPAPTLEQPAILDKYKAEMQGADPASCCTTLCEGGGERHPDVRGMLPDQSLVERGVPAWVVRPRGVHGEVRTAWKSLWNILTSTWRLWRKK